MKKSDNAEKNGISMTDKCGVDIIFARGNPACHYNTNKQNYLS